MVHFASNWYIDMGINGMLNLLKKEFLDNTLKLLNKTL